MGAEVETMVAPLFVPGDRPDRFPKAARSGADAIIIDLEDAVAPDAKLRARNSLRLAADLQCLVLVRVNARSTKWNRGDILALRGSGLSGIVIPKVESPDDIASVLDALGEPWPVVALVETARGLARAREIASGAVCRLAFGSVDLAADLGCAHSHRALQAARAEVVLASRLAQRPAPLDGVTLQVRNPETLAADLAHAGEMGFTGKLCIHPSQVLATLRGLRPSEQDVRWALAVQASAGQGVTMINGEMVDAPVRAAAARILNRAAAATASASPDEGTGGAG